MPIKFFGLLEDVEGYEGKNGFGANVTVSQRVDNRVKRLTFRIKDREIADKLEKLLSKQVEIVIELNQSNFGNNFGDILGYQEIK